MSDTDQKPLHRRVMGFFSKEEGEDSTSEETPADSARGSSPEEDQGSSAFKEKLASVIVSAVNNISNESDRDEIVRWFVKARSITQAGGSRKEIAQALYDHVDTKRTFQLLWGSVATTLKNYKDSDLPLSIKVALPVTAAGAVVLGGAGAGLGMFGGAIGLPVVVILFLGTAGLTSVVEAFIKNEEIRSPLTRTLLALSALELKRRLDKELADLLQAEVQLPHRADVPEEEAELRQALLQMDPTDFERHVMSFFQADGLDCAVSPKGRDKGIDGWADHPQGLLVVQCKRYAEDHPVGRPLVQQLKGVVEETEAFRGYMVTTSRFTREARESAGQSPRIVMVDLDALVSWHGEGRRAWEQDNLG